ncbi:LamB/YcsF family protein [Alkaliphilus transvaalensis]|uniref:LamB/YcsF family protein n=1 Tax=Alkaliphilus transvaalensis TaxID=114628 RepID=UPI0004793F21|nr:5-oxoprolinase subunit PxpA [Alkaliphilus transvaalensis]
MYVVDLNCDLGESFGDFKIGNDDEILKYVTSANIACGFHAGDPVVMGKTVVKALKEGVAIGAHPGFPDLMGFGRRNMNLSLEEIKAYITYQIGALNGFLTAYGGRLQHVKPHGALYNMAAKDYSLARAMTEAIYQIDNEIIFVGLANSSMIKAGKDVGLPVVEEVFADRNYNHDGTLVSRSLENALIHDTEICYQRVIKMIKDKTVTSIDGREISINADTICIHGDHPKAMDFAKKLREMLLVNQVELKAMGEIL